MFVAVVEADWQDPVIIISIPRSQPCPHLIKLVTHLSSPGGISLHHLVCTDCVATVGMKHYIHGEFLTSD